MIIVRHIDPVTIARCFNFIFTLHEDERSVTTITYQSEKGGVSSFCVNVSILQCTSGASSTDNIIASLCETSAISTMDSLSLSHSSTIRNTLLCLTLLQTLLCTVTCGTANLQPSSSGGLGSEHTPIETFSHTTSEVIFATTFVVGATTSINSGLETTSLPTSTNVYSSVVMTTISPSSTAVVAMLSSSFAVSLVLSSSVDEQLLASVTILSSTSVHQLTTESTPLPSTTVIETLPSPSTASSAVISTPTLSTTSTTVALSFQSTTDMSQRLSSQLPTSTLSLSTVVSEPTALTSLSPSTTVNQPGVEISASPSTTVVEPSSSIAPGSVRVSNASPTLSIINGMTSSMITTIFSIPPTAMPQPSMTTPTTTSQPTMTTPTISSQPTMTTPTTTSQPTLTTPTISSQPTMTTPTITSQQSMTSVIQMSSAVLPTQPMSMTSSLDETTTNQIATTQPPSIIDRIRQFFEELDPESRIGIYAGAGVVALLLIIVCFLCCCCFCSRLRRRRKEGRVDLTGHRKSLTISNPIALVSSHGHNGNAPARYRSTLHDSSEYSDSYNIHDLDEKPFSFPSSEYHETCIDEAEKAFTAQHSQVGHTTQPSQMTQMSTTTDIFREKSLPKLSPLSYSSQLLTAPQFPTHYPSLSVDENDPHTSIGSRRPSLLAIIPNTSPSLRVPTLMALSLKNEETKSAQGSKVSVHGSRTSIQGSRPSMTGSRGSVYTGTGSRSQIYSSINSSREHSSLLLNGPREFGGGDDDAVSLPLSSRGISPAMKQSSLEEVPTRDSPAPDIASHAVGYGKKDFASLTCIPNQFAAEAERLEERQQLRPVPEKQLAESEVTPEIEASTEVKKKPRSRTMSKLEKLTSLDYIRASLRLKKKKVSFGKTTESSPKHREKNANGSANSKVKVQNPSPRHEAPVHPLKDVHHSRRHSASGRAEFSPQSRAPPHLAANKYPDHYYYPQLSQPMYYGGGATMMHPGAVFYQYPQLSQQYYAQLSQGGYGGGAYPPHMVYPMEPYSRSYGEPPTTRYANMVTPELFDDTPEPEFYHERSPDNIQEQRQPNGLDDRFQSPGHSSVQPSSPDQFTETSETSSYLMQPPSASHLHEDPLTSAHKHFMEEFAMDRDHYGYGDHQHVPTYPGDMMGHPQVIPEAYREVYQGTEPGGMSHDYHMTGQQYTQYPGYGEVAGRRTSRSSYTSNTSDHTPLDETSDRRQTNGEVVNESSGGGASKTRVSWSTEVIEYQRTPSDLGDSDFDFNQF